MNPTESSLLVYLECCMVDYGGQVESVRMNNYDFAILDKWKETGYIQFGRIKASDIFVHNGIAKDHWVVLSETAWKDAHVLRRMRSERAVAKVVEKRTLLGLEKCNDCYFRHRSPCCKIGKDEEKAVDKA